ncbi:helix-turn-helix domain-containing protein [Paenibacillus sacheonensis]|uniref:Helix-turn-helix domain-containing protein n=1 Tax=Paenibacillus sacheonensis TaxID=742054 RepID=A0A7X4YL63_9BACL|nr:helix-turn-helix domain-containing protein [Paenibacillus sacheonensis]MBM7568739.1 AraC-like DNA-binding protein [Paenibacillus sacheonensis]NBC68422.1 helix-turn-helix domain-containing protein [Paenibacillus sacheonensis]
MTKTGYQRIYFRNFLIFICLFVIVFIPFVILLFSQFARYTMMELNETAQSKVNNIRYNTEFIFDKLKDNAYTIYNDQTIQNWYYGDPDNVLNTTAAIRTQNNFMFNEKFIARSYLINTLTRKVIDSKQGEIDYAAFNDRIILEKAKEQEYLTVFNHEVEGNEYLAMISPASPKKNENNFLVLLIDEQMIMNFLFGPDSVKGVALFILSADGKRLLGESDDQFVKQVGDAYLKNAENQFDVRAEGNRWVINEATTKSDWQIYYAVDYSELTSKVSLLKQQIIVFSCLVLALIAALFYWSSRRSLSPLSHLVDKLQIKLPKDNRTVSFSNILTHSEFSFMNKSLDMLLDNVESLHSSIRETHDLVRSEQLRQWLYQGELSLAGSEFLRSETKLLSRSCLYLAVIRIESYQLFCEQYDFLSRKLLKYAMRNIAEEILSHSGYAVECLDMGSDHILIWVGADEEESGERLQQRLFDIQAHIESVIKLSTAIAISQPGTAEEDFHQLYQHIYELTMLKFIKGDNQIFTEEQYTDLVGTVPSFENISEDIILSIRHEQGEEAILRLRQQLRVMAGVSYAECKLQLTLFVYEITKAFGRLNVIQEINGISRTLDQFHALHEAVEWMERLIGRIVEEISAPKVTGHKEEIVNEIKEFIHTNLHDPLLSLEGIADHLSLSVSYVRQLFKGITNISISDYILENKIEFVKKQLVSSDQTIAEIMDRSGFLTKSHFFSVFKKVTGLTPKQYRDMMK